MKHGKQTAWQCSLCKFDIFLKIIFPLLNFLPYIRFENIKQRKSSTQSNYSVLKERKWPLINIKNVRKMNTKYN